MKSSNQHQTISGLYHGWDMHGGMSPQESNTVLESEPVADTSYQPSLVDQIMAYEQGDMDEDTMIDFFQGLIDNGMAWTLQGHYGRQAAALIDAGLCLPTATRKSA